MSGDSTPNKAFLSGLAAGMYRHMGTINADSLVAAYRLLQNIDDYAHELHDRSLSIGDVLAVNGKAFMVEDLGFSELPPEGTLLLPHVPDRDF